MRIAQNLNDCAYYQLRDNDGRSVQGYLTAPEGPAAYYATRDGQGDTRRQAPGGHLRCRRHLLLQPSDVRHPAPHCRERPAHTSGLDHLPHLPKVAALEDNLGAPSMSVETAAAGVIAAIAAIQSHPVDSADTIVSRLQI